MDIVIDASGAGIGGIGVFLEEVVKNWPETDDLLVLGITKSRAKNLLRAKNGKLKIVTVPEHRLLGLLLAIFSIYQNRGMNSRILSLSPSLTSIAFRDNGTVIVHDFMYLDAPQFVSRPIRIYRKFSYLLSFKKCQKYIFVSRTTENRFLTLCNYQSKKRTVINPSSNLNEKMRPIPLIQSQISSKRKIVIVPGHTPNKGFSHIIKSIPYLHQNIVIVILTGSRGKMPEFSPEDKIIKLGWLSDEEYSWLLRSADCLAFLSDYEGFGIPIIEALQIGLPMILSMDPALIETAKGSGLIVDSSNPKQVGEAINLLTGNGFEVPVAPEKNWSQITAEIAKFVNE